MNREQRRAKDSMLMAAMQAAGVKTGEYRRLDDGTLAINGTAVLRMVLSSEHAAAVGLQDWLADELFPALRERGSYVVTDRAREVFGALFDMLSAGGVKQGFDPTVLPFYLPPKVSAVR